MTEPFEIDDFNGLRCDTPFGSGIVRTAYQTPEKTLLVVETAAGFAVMPYDMVRWLSTFPITLPQAN